jgi:uncharacterized protein YkwD
MRRAFPLVLVALLPLAFVAGGGASGQAAQVSPPSPPTLATDATALPAALRVDPRKREESRAFYRAIYASSEGVASGFDGNVDAGRAGTTSREFRDAIARRLNYFRAMAGVPADVTFDDELNRRAQLAALMMSANGQLSHVPPKTWRHYSDDGAQAAGKSNLNLADGPGAIDGYIEDFGDSNGFAGHRRWALYSAASVMGTGDVDAQGKNRAANALYTVNSSAFRAKPALREAFVAWPPPGFVPAPLVYPRWSFGLANGSLENAVVTMTTTSSAGAGASVPVRLEARKTGFGDDAIVWVPDGWDANSGARPAFGGDTTFHVTVDKAVVGGVSKRFDYDVTLFDPAVAGADAVTPTVRGPASPLVGTASAYAFDAVPGADAYVWEAAALASFALDDGAETGAGGFEAATSPGYAVASADHAASGTYAFHLAMPDPSRQRLTLKRAFLCNAATTLSFQSRLRLATPSQRPHVQVAIDGGSTWSDLWARPLATSATAMTDEAAFTKIQVALGAYAGKVVRVRFVYENTGNGQYFPQTNRAGWYFDDVRVAAAEEPLASVSHSVTTARFDFAARAPGRTALRVRSRHYGRYLLDWGPVTIVEARSSGAPPPPMPTTTATAIPTTTAMPTATATAIPTATATAKPTATSPFPFPLPTAFPTALPTSVPTSMPTSMPTTVPTGLPIPIPIPSIFRVPPPPWPT